MRFALTLGFFSFALALTFCSDTVAQSKSKFRVTENGSSCSYVGVKGVREFISTKKLVCLKSKRAASKQGYADAFKASFKTEEIHPFELKVENAQTVPPANSGATGDCTGTMNHDTNRLRIVCVHNIAHPTLAHLHMGLPGEKGPMFCDTTSFNSPVAFDCQLDAITHHALHDGEVYINLHSTEFPGGELRGQIVLDDM